MKHSYFSAKQFAEIFKFASDRSTFVAATNSAPLRRNKSFGSTDKISMKNSPTNGIQHLYECLIDEMLANYNRTEGAVEKMHETNSLQAACENTD